MSGKESTSPQPFQGGSQDGEPPIVTVYCVFADKEEAQRIGQLMVEESLAACVNILAPCRSFYRWNGKVEEAAEVPALFKTTQKVAERLVERLALLHSYDVPAIAVWPIEQTLGDYAGWVARSTLQLPG